MYNRYFEMFDLPEDQNEAAWGVTKRYGWNPWVRTNDEGFHLGAGDQRIASFDTEAELHAFVSGMATALLSIPPEVVPEIDRLFELMAFKDEWPGWWQERNLP